MQVESNRDISQNELYAGIGIAGAIGGAALAVRATSPIYKDDKKKTSKTASDTADEVLTPRQEKRAMRKAEKQFMKENKGRVFDVNQAYDMALETQKANTPTPTGRRSSRRNNQLDLEERWSTPGASSPIPQPDAYHEPAIYRKQRAAQTAAQTSAHTNRLERLRKMVAAAK